MNDEELSEWINRIYGAVEFGFYGNDREAPGAYDGDPAMRTMKDFIEAWESTRER